MKQLKRRSKDFAVNNLRPQLLEGTNLQYVKWKVKIEESRPKLFEGSRLKTWPLKIGLYLAATVPTLARNLWGKRGIRTGVALGITAGPNYLYGVRSWDPGFDKGAERMIIDSGPVARWMTAQALSYTAFTAMAPERMVSMANTMLAVEFGMCAIRMLAEQIAKRKTQFSGEVAGTGASPLTAFVAESYVKARETYPADPLKRFIIATRGIWGNIVRIVHASLIIAFGNPLWNALRPKPPVVFDPPRNEWGYPVMDKKDQDNGLPPAA